MSQEACSEIVSSWQEGILTIRMNRPEKKNALTHAMYRQLATVLQEAESDPAVRDRLVRPQPDSQGHYRN
jgi:enoyl-CoA hydratase/carnithine racemase